MPLKNMPVEIRISNWNFAGNWLTYPYAYRDRSKGKVAETLLRDLINAYRAAYPPPSQSIQPEERHAVLVWMNIRWNDIWTVSLLQKKVGFSMRQEARLLFWGVIIALSQSEWSKALERLNIFTSQAAAILQEDPLLAMECERWRLMAALNIHQNLVGVDSSNHAITYVEQHPRMSFSRGDYKSFRANLYRLRGKAHFGNLWFDEALSDMLVGLEQTHNWFAKHALGGPFPDLATLKQAYSVHASSDMALLPIVGMLRDEERIGATPGAKEWVTLYFNLNWQLAEVLMWRGRLSDARADHLDEIALAHVQAEEVMEHLMLLGYTIRFLRPHLPRAATMRAEMVFSRIDFLAKSADPSTWEPLLRHADELIEKATQERIQNPPETKERDNFPMYLAYMRLLAAYHRVRLSGDEKDLLELAQQVKLLALDAYYDRSYHMIGKCQYLLGHILKHIGQYAKALRAYHYALSRFERESDEVRATDVRLAIQNIRNT